MIIHGLNQSNIVKPLLFDASGNVLVSFQGFTSNGAQLHTDANGNLYTVPINGGYVSPMAVSARYENLTLAAGTNSGLTVTTVTASQVWEANVIGVRYTGTVAGVIINVFAEKGGVAANLFTVQPPTTNKYEFCYCNIVMDAGDILKATVFNATLNDDLVVVMSGRRIL